MTAIDNINTDSDVFSYLQEAQIHFGRSNQIATAQLDVLKALKESAYKAQQPVSGYRVPQSAVAAGGIAIMRFGGPDQGHAWNVQSITVGGLSPTVTAAGRADVFVTAMDLRQQANLTSIGLADWRDQAPTLPNIAFYGENQMYLRLNEELFVVISNATNGQQYVAVAQIQDIQEFAKQQATSL